MSNLAWATYPVGSLHQTSSNSYVLRTKSVVSGFTSETEKVFSDKMLTITGYYNRRGIIVGYELVFKGKPTILLENFFLVLDYVAKDQRPNFISFPKLRVKNDSSICLVKYGKLLNKRMYVFIYRRRKNV